MDVKKSPGHASWRDRDDAGGMEAFVAVAPGHSYRVSVGRSACGGTVIPTFLFA